MSIPEPSWFTDRTPIEHEIRFPGYDRQEAELHVRHERDEIPDDVRERELAELRRRYTMTVRLRPLDAGDVAAINEVRVSDGGGSIPIGEGRLLAIEMALVSWSRTESITRETIRRLNPLVAQAIYDRVDAGEDTAAQEPDPPTTGLLELEAVESS